MIYFSRFFALNLYSPIELFIYDYLHHQFNPKFNFDYLNSILII